LGEGQEPALSLSKERGTEQEVWDQSVGLFARAIEEAGMLILMLSAALDITASVKPPRAGHPANATDRRPRK